VGASDRGSRGWMAGRAAVARLGRLFFTLFSAVDPTPPPAAAAAGSFSLPSRLSFFLRRPLRRTDGGQVRRRRRRTPPFAASTVDPNRVFRRPRTVATPLTRVRKGILPPFSSLFSPSRGRNRCRRREEAAGIAEAGRAMMTPSPDTRATVEEIRLQPLRKRADGSPATLKSAGMSRGDRGRCLVVHRVKSRRRIVHGGRGLVAVAIVAGHGRRRRREVVMMVLIGRRAR
jgi:hypothetical protein